MNSKYEIPESIVIVSSHKGVTATLRFKTKAKDRIFSSNKKSTLYKSIERYVIVSGRLSFSGRIKSCLYAISFRSSQSSVSGRHILRESIMFWQ